MNKTILKSIGLFIGLTLCLPIYSCGGDGGNSPAPDNNKEQPGDNTGGDDNTGGNDQNNDQDDPNNPLVTKQATAETIALYEYIKAHYGKDILTSAMANVDWNTNECEWVYQHTGSYPAIAGFDFIHIYSQLSTYQDISPVKNWHDAGGLVTIMWHWNLPRAEGSDSNFGFYSEANHNSTGTSQYSTLTPNAVNDPTSWTYKRFVSDIQQVADIMLQLQDAQIPVLWRPLHEASGGWFWWGAGDAASYVKLWRLMYTIFQEKGVKNTIWVWTSEVGDDAWYPGDEYVDIIGRDKYNTTSASAIASDYSTLSNKYPNKMITLSECGGVSDMPAQWTSGATWSWVMPWYDYDRTKDISSMNSEEHTWANIAWWNQLLGMDNCITRADVDLTK